MRAKHRDFAVPRFIGCCPGDLSAYFLNAALDCARNRRHNEFIFYMNPQGDGDPAFGHGGEEGVLRGPVELLVKRPRG